MAVRRCPGGGWTGAALLPEDVIYVVATFLFPRTGWAWASARDYRARCADWRSGCPVSRPWRAAFDRAAAEGLAAMAMDTASVTNFLYVVPPGLNQAARGWLATACGRDGGDIARRVAVRWLADDCRRGATEDAQWMAGRFGLTPADARADDNDALRGACENGHTATAQWLADRFGLTPADARADDNYVHCGGHVQTATRPPPSGWRSGSA